MRMHKLQILLVIVAMLSAALACGGSVSTASISSAQMAKDNAGTQPTTVFAQDQVFYCVVELANAPDDTKLKAVWTAVDVEGEQPNTLINQSEITTSKPASFHLSPQGVWPKGKYKVDLYLNDKLDRTLEFQVQ
jgi:hypothetical protein